MGPYLLPGIIVGPDDGGGGGGGTGGVGGAGGGVESDPVPVRFFILERASL